jgi:hypothetical protein
MTLQEQYGLIKEGKGHKDVFMKQALKQFPQFVTQANTFDYAATILKEKGIIVENYIDLNPINNFEARPKEDFELGFEKFLKEEAKAYTKSSQEVDTKADSKKPSKPVDEYKEKSYSKQYAAETGDDVIFDQMLKGFQFETCSPKNEGKDYTEIRSIVLKNLAKDPLYYSKNAAFGVEGIGYTDQAVGYKPSKTDKMTPVSTEKPKSNVQDTLGGKEYKKGMPKAIKSEMTNKPKNSKGVKKMPLPGTTYSKVKLKEEKMRSFISKIIKEELRNLK